MHPLRKKLLALKYPILSIKSSIGNIRIWLPPCPGLAEEALHRPIDAVLGCWVSDTAPEENEEFGPGRERNLAPSTEEVVDLARALAASESSTARCWW